MTRAAAFAVAVIVVFVPAATEAGDRAASRSLKDPVSGVSWIQSPDGVLMRETAHDVVTSSNRAVTLQVYSSVTRAPLGGALAWWLQSDRGTPVLAESSVAADERGKLTVRLVTGMRLRVWAEGHELLELDAGEVARVRELALAPAAGATLQLRGTNSPASIRYFLGPRETRRELTGQSDPSGRLHFPGVPREGIRVELVDPRFAIASVTLHAGETRELTVTPTKTVTARVLDADGRAVAKAEARSFVRIGPEPTDVRRMTWPSDSKGVVTMSSLPPGEHVVEYVADGFVRKSVRIEAGSVADAADVVLSRGPAFVVVVRGEDGPIEGARVSLENGERLLTDRSGSLAIAGLDVRQVPQLRVSAENHQPATVSVTRDMKSPHEVRLRRGSGVRFRLVDATTGDPVEHARLRVRNGARWGDRDLVGPQGEYFAAGFDEGRMQLEIAAPGYLPAKLSAESAGGAADLGLLFLSRGAVVSGVLTDARTGQPLAGARLETVRDGGMGTMAARLFGDTITVTTTREGRFELSGLDAGGACVTITHPSVGTTAMVLDRIEENATREVGVVSLGETSAVEGTLHDSDKAPIRGASVELRSGPVYSPCLSLAATIDEKGQYRFEHVAPGPYHLVALRGHEVLGTRPVAVRPGETNHEDLEIRTVSVHGTVVADGSPQRGGMVMLKRAAGAEDFRPPTIFFSYDAPGVDARQRPMTDIVGSASFSQGPDGNFEGKARLDEGDYEVIWTPFDNSAWYHSYTTVSAGATRLEVPLQFNGGSLSGRAQGADGSPVAGAVIKLVDGAGRMNRTVFANADGTFVVPHVARGRWNVKGSARGLSAQAAVDVGAAPLDPLELVLRPRPPSRLIVQVAGDRDSPAIASVIVMNASGLVRMLSSAQGATFDDLPSGTYRIFGLDRRGGIIAGNSVAMEPGTITATLTPRPTRTVRLRVRSAEPGARVALLRDSVSVTAVLAYHGRSLSVLNDGTIELPPLSDGRWAIRIGDRTHDIDVSRDEIIELDD